MMDFWTNLLSGAGFMPRRVCGVWDDALVAQHVVSDVVIWLAYLWIPLVMIWSYYAHKKVLRLHGPLLLIFLLYTIFITACGWTHFFDALMFYNPVYRLNGVVRAVTAIASLGTAISLVKLMPQAITAPVTILSQQVALHQQYAWLRDILDSVTDGRLQLCETEAELPSRSGTETLRVEIADPGDLRTARKAVDRMAQATEMDPARCLDLISSVSEAAMNALVHTGRGEVIGYSAPGKLQVWIRDTGAGIPLDKLPISTLKQGYSTAGSAGQGWFMILSFTDSVYLHTGSKGTTVVLEMNQTADPQPVPFSSAVGGDIATA